MNNIIAGAHWVGMTIQGHRCGKAAVKNTGNVVHSINGSAGGVGFMVVPDYTDTE
jgi:hypothetical protein